MVVNPLITMTAAVVQEPMNGVGSRWNFLSDLVNELKYRVKPKCTIFRFSDLTLIAQVNPHCDLEDGYVPIVKDLNRKENKLWRLLDVDPLDQRALESRPAIVQKEDEYGYILKTPAQCEILKRRDPSRSREAWYDYFCWTSALHLYPGVYPRRYEFHPSYREYCRWLDEFPGWSHGPMRPSHCGWMTEYEERSLPMNDSYPC